MINLDGAASWKGRSADSLLDELFGPFLNGPTNDSRVHLVAVNDGRLMEWIEHVETQQDETALTLELVAALSHQSEELSPHIRLVELNNRSLVGGLDLARGVITTDFVDELVRRLVGGDSAPNIWAPCRTCTAQERCTMKRSADMMGASGDPGILADGNRLRATSATRSILRRASSRPRSATSCSAYTPAKTCTRILTWNLTIPQITPSIQSPRPDKANCCGSWRGLILR